MKTYQSIINNFLFTILLFCSPAIAQAQGAGQYEQFGPFSLTSNGLEQLGDRKYSNLKINKQADFEEYETSNGNLKYRVEKPGGVIKSVYSNDDRGDTLFRYNSDSSKISATNCSTSLSDKVVLGVGVRDGSVYCRTVTKAACMSALTMMAESGKSWSETAAVSRECTRQFDKMKTLFNEDSELNKQASDDRNYVESQYKRKSFVSFDVYRIGQKTGPLIDANTQNPFLAISGFTSMCAQHFPAVSASTRGFARQIFNGGLPKVSAPPPARGRAQ